MSKYGGNKYAYMILQYIAFLHHPFNDWWRNMEGWFTCHKIHMMDMWCHKDFGLDKHLGLIHVANSVPMGHFGVGLYCIRKIDLNLPLLFSWYDLKGPGELLFSSVGGIYAYPWHTISPNSTNNSAWGLGLLKWGEYIVLKASLDMQCGLNKNQARILQKPEFLGWNYWCRSFDSPCVHHVNFVQCELAWLHRYKVATSYHTQLTIKSYLSRYIYFGTYIVAI